MNSTEAHMWPCSLPISAQWAWKMGMMAEHKEVEQFTLPWTAPAPSFQDNERRGDDCDWCRLYLCSLPAPHEFLVMNWHVNDKKKILNPPLNKTASAFKPIKTSSNLPHLSICTAEFYLFIYYPSKNVHRHCYIIKNKYNMLSINISMQECLFSKIT